MDVRSLVAALMLLGSLVSCSDDEPTSDPQEPTSSATVSPSPTEPPSEPVMPEIARHDTNRGAAAFVEYYWQTVDYAEATGETQPLRALGAKGCDKCNGGLQYLVRVNSAGGRIEGDPRTVKVKQVRRVKTDGGVFAFVNASVVAPKSREYYGAHDKRNRTWPGGTTTYQFVARFETQESQWLLDTWEIKS
jgi:hypothetical protein